MAGTREQDREEERVEKMLTSRWTCGTEPSGRRCLAGSWQYQLEPGLLSVSQTGHVKFYTFVPAVLSACDTHPTASQLLNYYLLFKTLFHAGFPLDFQGHHLWAECHILSGFIINFM